MPNDPEPQSDPTSPSHGQQPGNSGLGAPQPPADSHWLTWFIIGLVAFAVIGGIAWGISKRRAAATQKPGAAGRFGPLEVAVVAGTVGQKDISIFLDGLGTVQAFNTVTIRARVDGELKTIAFVEGQDVRAGDLLAKIDPAPFDAQLAQNTAKKGQDEAQLANARRDLEREDALLKAKISSQQSYDAQKSLVGQLEGAVKADQAAIVSAQVQLAYTTITSPIDGRTGIRQVDQGNIVHANDANGIVVITQLHPISVTFTLPEQTLGRIHEHMAAGELTVLAVDRDNKTTLDTGKLAVIDNQIDTTTGTIKLKATFPNANLKLWPGQFVNARLLLSTRKGGVVVPSQVIQRGPDGAYAFVIQDDSTVQLQPVKVAQIEDGQALIDEGLTPGQQVVVDGQYRLQAGSKVRTGTNAPGGQTSGQRLLMSSPTTNAPGGQPVKPASTNK